MTERHDDERLDALLVADSPVPSPQFDERLLAALARVRAEEAAALDGVLAADRPEPSADFDRSFRAKWREVRAGDRTEARRAWLSRWFGWMAGGAVLAAAALAWVLVRGGEEPPEADLELLAHLDLLEVYEEVETLDALEDEETFEMVAALDDLDESALERTP